MNSFFVLVQQECPLPSVWDVHMSCSGNSSALKCQPWTCDPIIWSQSEFRCQKECPLSFSQNMNMATVGYPKKTFAWWDIHWLWPNGFSVSLSSQKTLNNSLKSRWILWFHLRSFPALIWDTSVSLDVSLGNLHSTWMSRESVSPVGFATK